jgi:hypothetical protein
VFDTCNFTQEFAAYVVIVNVLKIKKRQMCTNLVIPNYYHKLSLAVNYYLL